MASRWRRLIAHDCAAPALLLALCALLAAGCQGRFTPADALPPEGATSTPGGGSGGVGAISSVPIAHPLFLGVTALVAGDTTVRVEWSAAGDDEDAPEEIIYRVFLAFGPGDEDFTAPTAETAPGITNHTLTGLANGTAVYVVVRAVDLDGNEDPNVVEWAAMPNPIRYVNGASAAPAPDGKTPATAFRTLGQAIGGSIALGGVNIYVAEGAYSENAVLFPGMFLQGGFTGTFALDERDAEAHPTELRVPVTSFSVDVVTVLAGALLTGADGLQLDGNNFADNSVKIDDAFFRVSNCGIRHAVAHGIEIRSKFLEASQVEGAIRRCAVVNNGSEGISINALTDIVIDANLISGNGNEGIESQFVYGITGIDTRIDVTRNKVIANGEEGIDLDFAEVSETDPSLSQGARMRVVVRNNEIAENATLGLLLDIDYETDDGIDFRARVEDNLIRANALGGVTLDGDARGSFRLARNAITANGGFGIVASGTVQGPLCRLVNCRVLGNAAGGVRLDGRAALDVHNCVLSGNGGPAISRERAYVDVSGSVIIDNAGASTLDRARYTLTQGEVPAPAIGEGVIAGIPGFELHPRRIARALAGSGGAVIFLSGAALWQVGDIAEVRDDGVAREVFAVFDDRIVVDPAPEPGVRAGDAIFGFFPESVVTESEFLTKESDAIDAGDPAESDRGGSRADLGPRGGDTPGNVGIETGIAEEKTPLELIAIVPQPGYLQAGDSWRLTFNRRPPPEFASGVQLFVDGAADATRVSNVWDGNTLVVAAYEPIDFGALTTIVIEPFENPDPELKEPHRVFYDWRKARAWTDNDTATADVNGTVASAMSLRGPAALIDGAIATAADLDYYDITLPARVTLTAELAAIQIGSPLLARLSLFDASGSELLAQSEATATDRVDPAFKYTSPVEQHVLLRVQSTTAAGSATHVYQIAASLRSP